MQNYALLIIGFALLIKGADFFVEGSSAMARKLKVPGIIIGLTIVAMGTSAPECAVSIEAALRGSNAIAVSNVVGSNIFNLMAVCGACALFKPLPVSRSILKKEFPYSILAAVLLLFFCGDGLIRGQAYENKLGRLDGIIMLLLFLLFVVTMISVALKNRESAASSETGGKNLHILLCLLYIVGGLGAVILGANLVVDHATEIARNFGISETIIGLTIVSIGTSLPELVTSVVAAKKGEADMAVGNVVGSNLFNILLVLGVSSALSPIGVSAESLWDMVVLIVMSTAVYALTLKKCRISRVLGGTLILSYGAYLVYICIR